MSRGSGREIFAAIFEAWSENSDSSMLAAINGPFRDEASGPPEFPYCIIKTPVNSKREQSSTSEYWDHTIVFEIWDRTVELVEDHIANVGEIFDDMPLTPSIGTVLYLNRVDEKQILVDPQVYKGVLEYEILRSKPR